MSDDRTFDVFAAVENFDMVEKTMYGRLVQVQDENSNSFILTLTDARLEGFEHRTNMLNYCYRIFTGDMNGTFTLTANVLMFTFERELDADLVKSLEEVLEVALRIRCKLSVR